MAIEEQAIETSVDSTVPNAGATRIAVENPATGEVIGHVPVLGPDEVAALARTGRAVQPAWAALGFEGRGRILLRMQKWMTDNAERVITTVMSETGKVYEDAQLADWSYGVSAFGFWAKKAEGYLEDEKVSTASPFVKGKKLVLRHTPLGLVGVIGPWNYPV
ncbi:MAG: aldehyde dehydrogenase family protein, partial [Solirubrobacterales bacterium]|nr:aldehyde dehydrogenase family protein [Solirubrobacterales bacterium]